MQEPNLAEIRRFVKNWPEVSRLWLYGLEVELVDEFFREFHGRYEQRERIPHANLFRILRLGADELRHSRFLAWLLDREESHLQGARFLKALLRAAGLDDLLEVVDDDCVYEVWRERPQRIDLSIHARGRFAVFIENKINAQEGRDQLRRYCSALMKMSEAWNVPHERRALIFLTPWGREATSFGVDGPPDDIQYVPLSHIDLGGSFRAAVSHDAGCPGDIARAVLDYVTVTRRLISRKTERGPI